MFTVGADVASFFHPQEEEPVKRLMAVEAKPATPPGKQLGKEHGPSEPSDWAKGLCEGHLDSGLEAKVCGEDKVPSMAASRESVTAVAASPLAAPSPSSAEEGVSSSCTLHAVAAGQCFSSLLQCFPRLLHCLFFPLVCTAAPAAVLAERAAGSLAAQVLALCHRGSFAPLRLSWGCCVAMVRCALQLSRFLRVSLRPISDVFASHIATLCIEVFSFGCRDSSALPSKSGSDDSDNDLRRLKLWKCVRLQCAGFPLFGRVGFCFCVCVLQCILV